MDKNIVDTTHDENLDETRRLLIEIARIEGYHAIVAMFAVVGIALSPPHSDKATSKRAIRFLRGSNCVNGKVTQEQIEKAVCHLREWVTA